LVFFVASLASLPHNLRDSFPNEDALLEPLMFYLMAVTFAQFTTTRTGFDGPSQEATAASGIMAFLMSCCCPLVVILVMIVPTILGMWKVFEKAGEPGWAAIVPVYNYMVLAKIGGRDQIHGLLVLLPIVGIIFAILILMDVMKCFGKDVAYAIGVLFLPFVFWPMLGYSDAQYQRPIGPPRQNIF
jgi:hypothetical protein